MASCRALLIAAAAMAIVVGALLPATGLAMEYMVGNLGGWGLNVMNYNDWASDNSPFKVGDFLDFVYTQGIHSVVMLTSDDEGSEVSYNFCDVPINARQFSTGNDRVQLPDVKRVFFFCGNFDHCNTGGMKFAIEVYPSDG